jgi:hypothetical protein
LKKKGEDTEQREMSLANSTNPTNLVGLRPNASRGLAQGPKRAAVNSWLIMVVSGDGNGGWRGVDMAFKQRKINERQSGVRGKRGRRGEKKGSRGRRRTPPRGSYREKGRFRKGNNSLSQANLVSLLVECAHTH